MNSSISNVLDAFPWAPLIAVLGIVGITLALVLDGITFDQWMTGFGVVTAGSGIYAAGRNIRRPR